MHSVQKKGPTLFCNLHNFYKFKHILLIFDKQHHGGIAKLLLPTPTMWVGGRG